MIIGAVLSAHRDPEGQIVVRLAGVAGPVVLPRARAEEAWGPRGLTDAGATEARRVARARRRG